MSETHCLKRVAGAADAVGASRARWRRGADRAFGALRHGRPQLPWHPPAAPQQAVVLPLLRCLCVPQPVPSALLSRMGHRRAADRCDQLPAPAGVVLGHADVGRTRGLERTAQRHPVRQDARARVRILRPTVAPAEPLVQDPLRLRGMPRGALLREQLARGQRHRPDVQARTATRRIPSRRDRLRLATTVGRGVVGLHLRAPVGSHSDLLAARGENRVSIRRLSRVAHGVGVRVPGHGLHASRAWGG